MAYFSKEISLKEMVSHIYGKTNVISYQNRPHMFLKELAMYVDYFSNKVEEVKDSFNAKQEKYLNNFQNNLNDGINYYHNLFSTTKEVFENNKDHLISVLERLRQDLFKIEIPVLVTA